MLIVIEKEREEKRVGEREKEIVKRRRKRE
jgi:hypothetical protein